MSSRVRIRGGGGQKGLSGETEKILTREISRVVEVMRPWVLWPVLSLLMVIMHHMYGAPPSDIWVVSVLSVVSAGLAGLSYYLSHARGIFGQVHGSLTILVSCAFLCLAIVSGLTQLTLFIGLFAIPFLLCLPWSMRAVVRSSQDKENDHLNALFERAGAGQSKVRFKPAAVAAGSKVRKIVGKIKMMPGEKTVKDLTNATGRMESAMEIPPGTITITPDEDDASQAHITLSDPRVLRKPIPWPGAGHPGRSIAEPLGVGTWQDGEPVEWPILDTHGQVMGMTGSGKSFGACWNVLAEAITRTDVQVFGADITKGQQTLGPFIPALYRLETTKDGAGQMLRDIHAAIRPRTDYLAAKGMQKWEPGCGLTYIIVWLEECPDIIDSLGSSGEARFLSSLKAARSAGISIFLSLQRASWDQMPTLARSQLSKWCFGVNDAHDTSFGLTELQQQRDCQPELWGMRHPGMAYLDAPGIPEDRVSMPMRCFYFGKNDVKIKNHALDYPVSKRAPMDHITVEAMSGPASAQFEAEDAAADEDDVFTDEDREFESQAEDEIEDSSLSGATEFAPTPKVSKKPSPQDAETMLRQWLIDSKQESFSAPDLTGFVNSIGYTRTWVYPVLKKLVDADFLWLDDTDKSAAKIYHLRGAKDDWEDKAKRFVANGKDRAAQHNAPVDPNLKGEDLYDLYHASDCYLCDSPLTAGRQIDHKLPLDRGGAHALSNFGAACPHCNESKGNSTEAEYRVKMEQ
jgi:HNH endonuclease